MSRCFEPEWEAYFRSTTSVPFILNRNKPRGNLFLFWRKDKQEYLYLYRTELRNRLWNLYQVFLNGIGVCISDGSVDLNLSENQSNWKMFVLTHLLTKETITNTVGSYSSLWHIMFPGPKYHLKPMNGDEWKTARVLKHAKGEKKPSYKKAEVLQSPISCWLRPLQSQEHVYSSKGSHNWPGRET